MNRRTFLKAMVVASVGLPAIGAAKVETKKWRKWARLEVPTTPLREGVAPAVGWKQWQVQRILNDANRCVVLAVSA